MGWTKRVFLRRIFPFIFSGVSMAIVSHSSASETVDSDLIGDLKSILVAMVKIDVLNGLDDGSLYRISLERGYRFDHDHESFKPAPVSINQMVYFFLGTFSRSEGLSKSNKVFKTILHSEYQGEIRSYLIKADDVIALDDHLYGQSMFLGSMELIVVVAQVGVVVIDLNNRKIRLLTFDAWDLMHANKKLQWMKKNWSPKWLFQKGKKVECVSLFRGVRRC